MFLDDFILEMFEKRAVSIETTRFLNITHSIVHFTFYLTYNFKLKFDNINNPAVII